MAMERVLVVSILSLLAARIASSAENTTCTPVGDTFCECKGKGFSINLKDMALPEDNIPDTSPGSHGQYTYKFSPCSPIDCKTGGESNGVFEPNVVRHREGDSFANFGVKEWLQFNDDKHTGLNLNDNHAAKVACQSPDVYVARNNVSAKWTVAKIDPLQFTVIYEGGDWSFGPQAMPRAAIMHFTHNTSTTSIAMVDNIPNTVTGHLEYVFQVSGKTVVTAGGGGGGGGAAPGVVGLVLMSLFLAGIITYFIVGALVNYYHRGARGSEVIPNVTFWKDLPFLIKDGFLFTFSPCVSRFRRDEYQSL